MYDFDPAAACVAPAGEQPAHRSGGGEPWREARVLGGEVALWGEDVDGANVERVLWPRAAAAAERLWSPRGRAAEDAGVRARLRQFRCALLRRGVGAAPVGHAGLAGDPDGPGACAELARAPSAPGEAAGNKFT